LKGRGLSSATVNRHLAAFLAVWGASLQREGWRDGVYDPIPSGLYLREPSGRSRVVSEVELGAVCAELPPSYQGLAVFLYEVGCRVSEALKLEPQDVDLPRRRVTFRDTKTGHDRAVPLTTRAHLVLERAPSTVFAHLSQSALNHAWAVARERMGLAADREFVPHSLRHGAVTRWVRAGIPLPVVSQMAGHRSAKTTYKYAHVGVEDAQEWMQKTGLS
jgi:integrase